MSNWWETFVAESPDWWRTRAADNWWLGSDRHNGPGGAAEIISFRAGPSAAPALSTNAAGALVTYFPVERLPVESEVTKVEFYANATGAVSIMVAVPDPDGNGWNVTEHQVHTVTGTGLQTLQVSDLSLDPLTLPAGGLVGWYTAEAGILRYSSTADGPGYSYVSGKANGAGVVLAPGIQYEMQFAWEATATRGGPTFIINESFAGAARPINTLHGGTAWTYGGSAVPGAVGIANRLSWTGLSSIADRQTLSAEFSFTNGTGVAAIGKHPILGGASVDYGSLIAADIAGNAIIIYNPYNTASSLPVVRYTRALSTLTLAVGTPYKFELIKNGKILTAKITDLNTMVSEEFEEGPDLLQGYCNGCPSIMALAGGVEFTNVKWSMPDSTPMTTIYGDSITEGSGATTDDTSFGGQLIRGTLAGNGWYAGDGGVTAFACLRNMMYDTFFSMPKYAILFAGANNSGSDTEMNNYIAHMTKFVDKANQYGVTPIVMLPIPYNDPTRQGRTNTMRQAILANGCRVIRTDIALSVGGDGVTWNTTLMADSVHPNQLGHDAIAARCLLDAPDAFGLIGTAYQLTAEEYLSNVTWVARYDASDEDTIAHALGDVATIDDKSGNGYTLTASGGGVTTGIRQINSLNALDLGGAALLSGAAAVTAQPLAFFAVLVKDSAGTVSLVTSTGAGTNLFTNGTFDADVTGWSAGTYFTNNTLSWSAGKARVTRAAAAGNSGLWQNITKPGSGYVKFSGDLTLISGALNSGTFDTRNYYSGTIVSTGLTGTGSFSVVLPTNGTITAITLYGYAANIVFEVDNLTCYACDVSGNIEGDDVDLLATDTAVGGLGTGTNPIVYGDPFILTALANGSASYTAIGDASNTPATSAAKLGDLLKLCENMDGVIAEVGIIEVGTQSVANIKAALEAKWGL